MANGLGAPVNGGRTELPGTVGFLPGGGGTGTWDVGAPTGGGATIGGSTGGVPGCVFGGLVDVVARFFGPGLFDMNEARGNEERGGGTGGLIFIGVPGI